MELYDGTYYVDGWELVEPHIEVGNELMSILGVYPSCIGITVCDAEFNVKIWDGGYLL
ncbi:MAG: hypothetical protein U5Q03_01955 [Bacteroidota bacterium]|nr:hypothetical protein [Bacteroidota bacterium]